METRSLDEIRKECEGCRKCSLAETRTNVVFGVGNPNADVMFIGEAPGEKEDLSGIPFVGAAGKLFDKYLVAVGIPREEIYIANMLKCRPPKNRDPKPEEQDLCIEYLREQVRAVSPKLIVCLGRIAAMRLIKPDFRITAEHGIWFERGAFSVCAVYHPSALLRDPRKKDDMLADMMEIKRRLDALKQAPAAE
ncbi:MAG TPA: uracil-DNA glycosylase [Clostridiales bacterium]|nr:uracil-DNA glycosylase [Candidatus Apopatosoma intestinale]